MSKLWYISPSSQGSNLGINGYGSEQKQMRLLSELVAEHLQRCGVRFHLAQSKLTLQQRCKESNSMGADFHLALHSNAGGKGKAWGPIAFYHTGGKPLCQQLISQLKAIGQESNRASSIQRKTTLYELSATKAITCLLEVDFHNSEKGVAFITGHRGEIAEAIAKAVAAIDGTQWVDTGVQEHSLAQQKCNAFFDPDENGSYRWEEPLTRQEAAVALLRLQNQLAKEV